MAGFFDAISGAVGGLFGINKPKSDSTSKKSAVIAATKQDIDAALQVNLNSIQSMFQTYSMQNLQTQELVATEESSKSTLVVLGIGGMVLVLGLLFIKR